MRYLNDYLDETQTALFDELGIFFAFSPEQFNEGRTEGVKYVQMDGGFLCPKSNIKEFLERYEKVLNTAIAEDVKENGAPGIIEREFFNHEAQLTMDLTDTKAALQPYIDQYPGLFTPEVIREQCRAARNLAIENDWF